MRPLSKLHCSNFFFFDLITALRKPILCKQSCFHSSQLLYSSSFYNSDRKTKLLQYSKDSSNNTYDNVSTLIQTHYEKHRPSDAELQSRKQFGIHLHQPFKLIWPTCELHMFGSSVTGLCSSNSDIDVCLFFPEDRLLPEGVVLRKAARILAKRGVRHATPILAARVPILKVHTPNPFKYNFDLSVNRMLGVKNSALLAEYLSCDPRARPLAFAIRDWAKKEGVLNPSGGFNSYALTLLLIFYLQQCKVLPILQENIPAELTSENLVDGFNCAFNKGSNWKSENTQTLGQLLTGFFHFYATFNFMQDAISIRKGRLIKKTRALFKPRPVALEDPFEIDFNVARLVERDTLEEIVACFADACIHLSSGKEHLFLPFWQSSRKAYWKFLPRDQANDNNKIELVWQSQTNNVVTPVTPTLGSQPNNPSN